MSNLYITELDGVAFAPLPHGAAANAVAPVANILKKPVAEQKLTISGTTARSAAFNAKTQFIKVHCDGITSITFGDGTVVATTGSQRLLVGIDYYFDVNPGDYLAGITNT